MGEKVMAAVMRFTKGKEVDMLHVQKRIAIFDETTHIIKSTIQ